ncbi:hypothetical protein BDI4_50023 [Burkholderia diffusa]|nr:hypothetical protein BDI4_50023 [Burkholderia diffusa]
MSDGFLKPLSLPNFAVRPDTRAARMESATGNGHGGRTTRARTSASRGKHCARAPPRTSPPRRQYNDRHSSRCPRGPP